MLNCQEIVENLSQIRGGVLEYIYHNMKHEFITKIVCPKKCIATFVTAEGLTIKYTTYIGISKRHTSIEIEGQVDNKPLKINFNSEDGDPFNGKMTIGEYGIAYYHIRDKQRNPVIIPCRNILGNLVPIRMSDDITENISLMDEITKDIETMLPADIDTKIYSNPRDYKDEEERKRFEKAEGKSEKLILSNLIGKKTVKEKLFDVYEQVEDNIVRHIFRP